MEPKRLGVIGVPSGTGGKRVGLIGVRERLPTGLMGVRRAEERRIGLKDKAVGGDTGVSEVEVSEPKRPGVIGLQSVEGDKGRLRLKVGGGVSGMRVIGVTRVGLRGTTIGVGDLTGERAVNPGER